MLGKVVVVSLFLANVLIINVSGKSSWKLIETEDEPDTRGGAIVEAKPCISKECFVLDYFEPGNEPNSVEAIPDTGNIYVTPSLPGETGTKDPIDWSKFPQEWVDKKNMLSRVCRVKVIKKETHKEMCRKWRKKW